MSFINEALKKAQKEKDTQYIEHNGLVSAGGRESGIKGGRLISYFLLLMGTIILGILVYSLLIQEKTPTDRLTVERQTEPIVVQKIPAMVGNRKDHADAGTYYSRAKELHKTGALNEAKELYMESLRRDPGYLDSLNNLGIIYINEKDYTTGRKYLEKAIRLKPDYPDPYYNLACLFSITGDTRLSIEYLKRAVTLDPSVKEWAKKDTDLENLRGEGGYEDLLNQMP